MTATDIETNHWIIVSSLDNWRTTAAHDFTLQGIKSRHRKKAELMQSGDKIVYYVTRIKAFAGIATITSDYFESHERIWTSGDPKKAAEDYPFRVEIAPDLILDEASFVPAEGVARRMEYAKKWPEKNWTLAFQGNVHQIGDADYRLIRGELEARLPEGAVHARAALR